MQRGSARRGVFVLTVVVMMVAAGPASFAAGDSDDASLSEGCDSPTEHDLIGAGGKYSTPGGEGWVDVGGVRVWDDGVTLFVQFFTDVDNWRISGIHLHVGDTPDDVPQTKKGNTKPGKFDVKAEFDPWVTETPIFEFPLSDFDGTPVIAAHADLWDSMTISMVSKAGGAYVYGPLNEYAAIGDPSWVNPAPAVATWVHPLWPTIPGATWISNTYYIEGVIAPDTWRLFEDTIPGTVMESYELQTASMVTATADNAEEVYVNGTLVGSDGVVQGPYVDNFEWGTLVDYDLAPYVNEGEDNELSFIVRNYTGGASPQSNPTGLIYEIEADYLRGESGWGAGEDFGGKDWSMYLEYNTGACVLP